VTTVGAGVGVAAKARLFPPTLDKRRPAPVRAAMRIFFFMIYALVSIDDLIVIII
jgi:hypothetical protein